MTEFEKMIKLLDMAWYMRGQIVPCLVGPPGIGKTAAVMQHAKSHGCGKVVKIVASRCVPSETVGMTMPVHSSRSMTIYNSVQLSSLEDGDVLFLDELLEADQFVLSTLLTVIESREMADGTPLPDIQIVAATNDTISPEQLKGNIRQRFMFQRFKTDRGQTIEYIRELTGMELPYAIATKINDNGSDYNFLTPRSLTKLCMWVDAVPSEKLDDVQEVINEMWNSEIGTEIVSVRKRRDDTSLSPEKKVRRIVGSMCPEHDFEDCTFSEMLETLKNLPDWSKIEEKLKDMKAPGEERS